jgi:hypothetical protein
LLALALVMSTLAVAPPANAQGGEEVRWITGTFDIEPGSEFVTLTCPRAQNGWWVTATEVVGAVPADLWTIGTERRDFTPTRGQGMRWLFYNRSSSTIRVTLRVRCLRFISSVRVGGDRAQLRVTTPRVNVAHTERLQPGVQVVECGRGYTPIGYAASGALPSGPPSGSPGPSLNYGSLNGFRLKSVGAVRGGFGVELDRVEQFVQPSPQAQPTLTALCQRRSVRGRACRRGRRRGRRRCRPVRFSFATAVRAFSGQIEPNSLTEAQLRCPRGWLSLSAGHHVSTEDPALPVIPGFPGPSSREVFDPIRGIFIDFSNHSNQPQQVEGYALCSRQGRWRVAN